MAFTHIELYLDPYYFTLLPYLYPTAIVLIGVYLTKNIFGYMWRLSTKLSLKFFGGSCMLGLTLFVSFMSVYEIFDINALQEFKNKPYMAIGSDALVRNYKVPAALSWDKVERIKALGNDPLKPTGIRLYLNDGSFETYDKTFTMPMAEALELMLQAQKVNSRVDLSY